MLLVCCFCDRVRDATMCHSHWHDLEVSLSSRRREQEDIVLSYTCCRTCLVGDPRARVFRARQTHLSLRRTIEAG
jgi:hypothetical protein